MKVKKNLAKKLSALGLSISAALAGGYLIIPYEGSVTNSQGVHVAYKDPVGIDTACYGQTGKDLYGRTIRAGMRYTEDECLQMLTTSIQSFERSVDRLVKVDYASYYQKAALISFAYNVGEGNLATSTLLRNLNSGNHIAACNELSRWVYAQKRKLKGLEVRREEERRWCLGEVPYDPQTTLGELIELVSLTTKK